MRLTRPKRQAICRCLGYYSQGEVEVGRWIGLGGQQLGLIEGLPVDREAFMRLCDNLEPSTGELLTQRMKSERRVFFDFTCSAPKSVSIMAVTMNDERILRAHQLAARTAAKELASFAAARVRKQGAMEDRLTGSVVGAEFLHSSSRALDPQLHTHFTIFNSTFDPVEQRWKALQTSAMFNVIHYEPRSTETISPSVSKPSAMKRFERPTRLKSRACRKHSVNAFPSGPRSAMPWWRKWRSGSEGSSLITRFPTRFIKPVPGN